MLRIVNLCLLLLVCSTSLLCENLTLEQAVETARTRNYRVLQYKNRVEQKRVEKKVALGNYLPTVSLDGTFNHLNDDIILDFSPIREAMLKLHPGLPPAALPADKFRSQVKEQDNYALSLTAVQPLFTGFKITAGYNAAAQKLDLAETEFQQTENTIIRETTDNYLNAVVLNRILKIRRSVLSGMQEHRANAEKLLKTGLIDRSSYLSAEVAVSDAERNLSDDQNKLKLAMIALKSSMGINQGDEIAVIDSLALVQSDESLENQLIQAKSNQPAFKLLEQNKALLQDKKQADQADYYPTLAAFGKYEVYQDDLSLLEPEWAVGLKLSYNIFSGLKDYHEVETTQIQLREIEYIQKETENKIDLFVRKARTDVDNSKNRYLKLASAVDLATENLKLNRLKFETGMGTSLDVIDAQLQLEKVLIEQYSSLYSYYTAINELNYAQGKPMQIFDLWKKR